MSSTPFMNLWSEDSIKQWNDYYANLYNQTSAWQFPGTTQNNAFNFDVYKAAYPWMFQGYNTANTQASKCFNANS